MGSEKEESLTDRIDTEAHAKRNNVRQTTPITRNDRSDFPLDFVILFPLRLYILCSRKLLDSFLDNIRLEKRFQIEWAKVFSHPIIL